MHLIDQRRFIRAVKIKCNLTWKELGKICGVKGKTVKVNYYLRGFTLPLNTTSAMSNISGVSLPSHKLLPADWGRMKGAQTIFKKFSLKNPSSYSEELAELIGILMGDGCLCKFYYRRERREKYLIEITGHARELRYYEEVIRPLFEKLFGARGYLHNRSGQQTLIFVVKSKRIYQFLKSVGMPEGTKNKCETFVIPSWILVNSSFTKACIRGLTDTDGAVFKSHGRWVNIQYKFASRSLTQSLHNALVRISYHPTRIGKVLNFNPESKRTNVCWQFYLSRGDEVRRFANEIGFNNFLLREKYRNADISSSYLVVPLKSKTYVSLDAGVPKSG